MTGYENIPESESLIPLVNRPTRIRRKPLPASFQLPSPKLPFATNTQARDDQKSNGAFAATAAAASAAATVRVGLSTDDELQTDFSSDSKIRHRGIGVWRLWKWELLSLAASASLMIGVVITLRRFDGKDLADWKAPISINTVVSVLSALFKGSLGLPVAQGISQLKWLWFSDRPRRVADLDRFDRASRSTWGAVRLIARQFGPQRLSPLAGFGAFLVLLTLVVDPFSQASVSIVTCQRTVATGARVPRANVYSANGGHVGAGINALDAPMQIAFYTGMTQPPANSSLSVAQDVTCPSANCTFPSVDGGAASFITLTMCHSCRDVTASITPVTKNKYMLVMSDGRNVTMEVQTDITTGRYGVAFSLIASEILYDGDTEAYPEGPWHRTSLADFQGIAATNTNASCLGAHCDWRPFAFDCSLRPCVKTFAANVSKGVYREEELSRQYLHYLGANQSAEPRPEWIWSFQLAVNRTLLNGTWVECEGAQNASGSYSVAVPQNEGPDPIPVLWYLPECVYIMRTGAIWAISRYFQDAISSGELSEYTTSIYYGDAWKRLLWNNSQISLDTVNRFSEGIAYAIGAQIRRAGEPLGNLTGYPGDVWSFANGHGFESRSCIQVRWKWLSFLVTLFLAEVAFLAIVMVTNRRSQWSGDWKSSTLPLLSQNVTLYEGESTKQEGSIDNTSELYKAANGVRMRFCQVDGKWRLVADEPRST